MNSEKMTLKTDVTTKVVQNSKKVKKSATFKATKEYMNRQEEEKLAKIC